MAYFRGRAFSRRTLNQPSALSNWIASRLYEQDYIKTVPALWFIRRTDAGCHQRSAGAWSFTLETESDTHGERTLQIGSQWPASELKRDGIDIEIDQWGHIVLYPAAKKSAETTT